LTASIALLLLLGLLITVAVQRPAIPAAGPVTSWVCYYGADRLPAAAAEVDLVVLDGGCHRDLPRNRRGRPIYLAYVSIGEVAVGGPWWSRVEDRAFLVRHNDFWNAWAVDVADPDWQDLVVGDMVTAALNQGFDGILIDGVDQALGLTPAGTPARERCRGHLTALIARIRRTHPAARIALNRGLEVLDSVGGRIDFLVLEGLFSIYDPDTRNYRPVAPFVRDQLLGHARRGRRAHPGLPVLTLDYAPFPGHELACQAAAFSRANGFVPYVSVWDLNTVFLP
jgi:hypothetical protein